MKSLKFIKNAFKNFPEILEGFTNNLLKEEHVELIAQKRLEICRACPKNSVNAKKEGHKTIRKDEHCIECGCVLAYKTRVLSQACPLGKWEALMTKIEEEAIKEKKDEKQD